MCLWITRRVIQIKIGVDIDNVVYSTTQAVLDVHYENTGERLYLSDIKTYCIEDYVSEKYKKDFHKIFLDKRVWKRVELLPNCVKTIKKLHDMGHEIYFVTATETANVHKKFQFLCRTFPFIDVRKRLITTQCKQMIKMDVLIDDCVDNLVGGDYYGILFSYPWNTNFKNDKTIERVDNWSEVPDAVRYFPDRYSTQKFVTPILNPKKPFFRRYL